MTSEDKVNAVIELFKEALAAVKARILIEGTGKMHYAYSQKAIRRLVLEVERFALDLPVKYLASAYNGILDVIEHLEDYKSYYISKLNLGIDTDGIDEYLLEYMEKKVDEKWEQKKK